MAKKKSTDTMDEQMFDSAVEEAAEDFLSADSPMFYVSESSETEMNPPDRDAYNTDSNGWGEYEEGPSSNDFQPEMPTEGESDDYNAVLHEMGESVHLPAVNGF